MSRRLLLVNPRCPESFWSFRWAVTKVLPDKRAVNPPLGLATLAALCPPDWEVTIVDENVESIPLAPQADLVGVCGMGVQFERQRELLSYYRGRGYRVVAGGSFASLCPERYADLADTVIAGEAEYIWPRFCADLEAGRPLPLYRETGTVDLADSPTPRFELLNLAAYTTATLQFSRGCPYRCDFCDIIVMFGRKPRCKGLAQVERELDALRALGARNVFFVDDNLIGNRPLARALLVFLADYQARHGRPFGFGTEASINLAQDDELLGLFRAAGFTWVFIGIETNDAETLKAAQKTQNLKADAVSSVRRIYAHGIDVLAGFIVGFDNDTLESFERQYELIMDSGIQAAMVGLLTALPRTPLHERLAAEGRLRENSETGDNTRLATNVVPRHMGYDEMISAYRRLYHRLLDDAAIGRRLRAKTRHMGQPVYRAEYSRRTSMGIVARLLALGVLRGGPRRVYHFLRSMPITAPARLPLAIADWIAALAMRDYVDRHFSIPGSASVRAESALGRLERALAPYMRDGRAALELMRGAAPRVSLELRGVLDRRLARRCARRLRALLRDSGAEVTLHFEALGPDALRSAQHVLDRLAQYGDRVRVRLAAELHGRLRVDSSVFGFVLPEATRG